MSSKKENTKKINSKLVSKKDKLNEEKKRKFKIFGFIFSIVLLVFFLYGILFINTKVKSGTKELINLFEQAYNSDDINLIFYYDKSLSDDLDAYELTYLSQINKDYKIQYLPIDKSSLSSKNRENIESKLQISGDTSSLVVVRDGKIIDTNEGFLESHNLVNFLINSGILKEGSKYKAIDNIQFINYDEYLDILENKKNNVVVIGTSGCQYCAAIKPILNNISKAYEIDIYYLNVDDIKKEELKELFEKLPELGYDNEELIENETFSMPTMLIIKKGKITSYLEDSQTLEKYIEYLKDNEIIE